MNRRILILTASFGDGHNAAARGLSLGLAQLGGAGLAREIHDVVRDAEPVRGRWLQTGYKVAITHLPWVWRGLYNLAERLPFSDERLVFLTRVEHELGALIHRVRPAAIVSTFPLYPHLLGKLARPDCPVFTVVTDSISINQVWISRTTDFYFAADELSADELKRRGISLDRIFPTGFPVNPVFAEASSRPPDDFPGRILFLPTASRASARRSLVSLLSRGPDRLDLTVVLGRHESRLRPVVDEVRAAFPGRDVTCLGWTDDIPALMQSHDLVISKAGGATTHECAAAGRPLLINQIVPGQEEGNAELVQRRTTGWIEERPDAIGPLVRTLFESGRWRRSRDAAWARRNPHGAIEAARIILEILDAQPAG